MATKILPQQGVLARYLREMEVGDEVKVRFKYRTANYVTKITTDVNAEGDKKFTTNTSGNVFAIVTRIK